MPVRAVLPSRCRAKVGLGVLLERVLYLSYDGLLEPLGRSQILPYLDRLSDRKVQFFLLTFEKSAGTANGEVQVLRRQLDRKGIVWNILRYHKTPTVSATLYDVLIGIVVGFCLVRRRGIQLVHARSYVPALIALVLKKTLGVPFLFDMRGFWADERVDGKIWREGSVLYRLTKVLEKVFLKHANGIISLTHAARKEIVALEYLRGYCSPVTVIPTCVDLDRFRMPPDPAATSGSDGRFVLVYSGSLETWYLLDEMLAFFQSLKRLVPQAHFLILTGTPEKKVKQVGAKYGLGEPDLGVRLAPFSQMPELLVTADVGIIFSRPSWSNKARCPTKLAEFLACGLPVIVSRGIGDIEYIVKHERVGVVVDEFTPNAYEVAQRRVLDLLKEPNVARRCRHVAEKYFSLESGAQKYWQAYEMLASPALCR